MRRAAIGSLVSLCVACGPVRFGLESDGMGRTPSTTEGCDRTDLSSECGGGGYDLVVVALTAVVLLPLLLPKLFGRE
jgi:hypothetical protein